MPYSSDLCIARMRIEAQGVGAQLIFPFSFCFIEFVRQTKVKDVKK